MTRDQMIDLIVNREIEAFYDWQEGSLFKILKFGFAGYVDVYKSMSDQDLKSHLVMEGLMEGVE